MPHREGELRSRLPVAPEKAQSKYPPAEPLAPLAICRCTVSALAAPAELRDNPPTLQPIGSDPHLLDRVPQAQPVPDYYGD